jgi:hypothetical protein
MRIDFQVTGVSSQADHNGVDIKRAYGAARLRPRSVREFAAGDTLVLETDPRGFCTLFALITPARPIT